MIQEKVCRGLFAAIVIAMLGVFPMYGDGAPGQPQTAEESHPAEGIWSRLSIHGFLTQAYAKGSDHQIYGIPKEGSADYRKAALQFSYAMTDKDRFVVQFGHQRQGKSPYVTEGQIDLDWGFYERRFGTETALQVGKIQLPFGIYNELRNVGTVLPFYRIPANVYGDKTYTNATLDGVSLFHRFNAGSDWNVEATGYVGGWNFIETLGLTSLPAEARNAVGGQVWMGTPVEGLRLGVGAQTFENVGGFRPEGYVDRSNVWIASVDFNRDRFAWQGEYSGWYYTKGGGSTPAWYTRVGYKPTEHLQLNAQYDTRRLIAIPAGPVLGVLDGPYDRDLALGANYFFRPDVVLKGEVHHTRSFNIEEDVDYHGPLPKANYAIVSLSVSF